MYPWTPIASAVTRLVLLCAVLFNGSVFVPAQNQPDPQWKEQLNELEQKVKQGKWEEVRLDAQFISESLAERSGGTRGDKRKHADELKGAVFGAEPVPEGILLGQVAAYRAIAEAKLWRWDEARWHWYIAQNLAAREVGRIDLSPYEYAGNFLEQQSLRNTYLHSADLVDVFDPVRPEGQYSSIFQPPVRTKVVYPRVPHDLHSRDRFSEAVNIQITVDETGRIVQPMLISAGFYPGAVYRAFEALREWRFEPAKLNGKAVAFRYVVPVVFADDRPGNPGVSF